MVISENPHLVPPDWDLISKGRHWKGVVREALRLPKCSRAIYFANYLEVARQALTTVKAGNEIASLFIAIESTLFAMRGIMVGFLNDFEEAVQVFCIPKPSITCGALPNSLMNLMSSVVANIDSEYVDELRRRSMSYKDREYEVDGIISEHSRRISQTEDVLLRICS